MDRCSATSLGVSDADGHVTALQLLVVITLTAPPNINVLRQDENDLMRTQRSWSKTTAHAQAR